MATFTNSTKTAASPSNLSKIASDFVSSEASNTYLLVDDSYYFLIDESHNLIIDTQTVYSNLTKV